VIRRQLPLILAVVWIAALFGVRAVVAGGRAETVATSVTGARLAVILLNWTDDTSQPFTAEQARAAIFTDPRSVAAFYTDTSYGRFALTGDVFGPYTVAYSKDPCLAGQWAADARARAGVSGYDHFMYVWPAGRTQCAWGGIAEGVESFINVGLHEPTMAHEFGHNLGLAHAQFTRCTDVNGISVQVSGNCVAYEQADLYDDMGRGWYTFNAPHRASLGWLTSTVTATRSGTFTIAPLEWTTSAAQQVQVVPKKKGKITPYPYCVEFRQSYGWDAFPANNPWITNGVLIHHDFCMSTAYTHLMDATPGSHPEDPGGAALDDAPLLVGQTFADPDITMTTLSVSPAGAVIAVVIR